MSPRRRRILLVALAVAVIALIAAPAALAAAGGGSSGFGGGDGGGGGGGGGNGFVIYIVVDLLIHIAVLGHGTTERGVAVLPRITAMMPALVAFEDLCRRSGNGFRPFAGGHRH